MFQQNKTTLHMNVHHSIIMTAQRQKQPKDHQQTDWETKHGLATQQAIIQPEKEESW